MHSDACIRVDIQCVCARARASSRSAQARDQACTGRGGRVQRTSELSSADRKQDEAHVCVSSEPGADALSQQLAVFNFQGRAGNHDTRLAERHAARRQPQARARERASRLAGSPRLAPLQLAHGCSSDSLEPRRAVLVGQRAPAGHGGCNRRRFSAATRRSAFVRTFGSLGVLVVSIQEAGTELSSNLLSDGTARAVSVSAAAREQQRKRTHVLPQPETPQITTHSASVAAVAAARQNTRSERTARATGQPRLPTPVRMLPL